MVCLASWYSESIIFSLSLRQLLRKKQYLLKKWWLEMSVMIIWAWNIWKYGSWWKWSAMEECYNVEICQRWKEWYWRERGFSTLSVSLGRWANPSWKFDRNKFSQGPLWWWSWWQLTMSIKIYFKNIMKVHFDCWHSWKKTNYDTVLSFKNQLKILEDANVYIIKICPQLCDKHAKK